MFERVRIQLVRKSILQDIPLIVGLSGGPDSLCLLDVMVKLGYSVVAAHYNHLLRSEASEDARFVEDLAAQRGIPFVLGVGSAADYAQEKSLSIEEAARDLRYRFLFEQAEQFSAQAVAVAHNADDQVETVLMHLLRGAGLDGLTGMSSCYLPNPWSQTVPLLRPLIGIWRTEIVAYCKKHNLTPVEDQTNRDPTYFRNRLRHELIPELETYIPGFRARLRQTTDLLTADHTLLKELTEKTWQEINAENGPGYAILGLRSFNLQSLALRRRLIRKAISYLRPGARDVDFAMVQRALEFVENPPTTGQADLGLGLRIAIENGNLLIAAWEADLPVWNRPQITATYELSIPGELDLDNGWIFRAENVSDVEAAKIKGRENRDPYRAWVDLGNRQPLLIVRPRRAGDRFQPLGMRGKSMKISDLMINEKIPQRARAGWPLICVGDEIAWVPGYRMGESFRLTPEALQVVKLTFVQK